MENFSVNEFLATGRIDLSQWPTRFRESYEEEIVEEWLDKVQKKLAKLQDKMYSHNRYAVLICLQGMDTAGKDSLIREVFKELNVRGIVVHSFKTPTSAELEHDYLWRHYLALPEKGKFAVFNRTHYE
ncbi:MAG TPA: polyphosphate kinase 2 family protein, partial [Flavobacterium sp.]|nr:polyphosphate kinase 2 family protein [Flavobacterium sp.]